MRTYNIHLHLATEKAMKKEVNLNSVPMTYVRTKLEASGKTKDGESKTTDALIAVASLFDIWVRDRDARLADGTAVHRTFLNDPQVHGRRVLHAVLGEDFGGQSSKWTIGLRDVEKPCAAKATSVFASAEAEKPEHPKPISSVANYEAVNAHVDGWEDIASTSTVQVEKKSVVVPKQSVRQVMVPVLNVSEEEAAVFKERAASREGSASERAARRADVPHNSARLVCFGGKCLGVRAGDLCFAFRGEPPSAEAAKNAEVLENEVYYSMDLLALSAALGHGDTSGCICAWCRSDAAGFKLAAGAERKVLDTRTLLSEMEDLEKYLAAVARAKARNLKHLPTNVNGVCGRSVFVAPFSHVIPPYLHLVLGLVNGALKEILEDLAKLSSVDHAALERQRERVAVLEQLEGGIGAAVGELVDLLGPAERRMVRSMVSKMDTAAGVTAEQAATEEAAARQAADDGEGGEERGEERVVAERGEDRATAEPERGPARSVPVPGMEGSHVVVGELAAADWAPLLAAARASATAALEQGMVRAADWRERGKKSAGADGKPRGPARTQRQLDAETEDRSTYEEFCQNIEAKAKEAHKELVAAVVAVETAIKAHHEYDEAECEGPDSKEDDGELVALMKYVLNVHGISIQRYWNGALVGPDCRAFLEKHGEILGAIRQGIVAAGYGDADAKDFVDRHTAVLKELEVVSRITRRVKGEGGNDLLSTAERTELKMACAAFGAAWRGSYHRILTPKGHIVEVHVPWFVDRYGICGVFGEDGAEAVHVVDNLCRRLVRQMRNPEDRHKAHTLHHVARDFTKPLDREIHKRQSAKQKAAKEAAAAAAAAAGLFAAPGAAVAAEPMAAEPMAAELLAEAE